MLKVLLDSRSNLTVVDLSKILVQHAGMQNFSIFKYDINTEIIEYSMDLPQNMFS